MQNGRWRKGEMSEMCARRTRPGDLCDGVWKMLISSMSEFAFSQLFLCYVASVLSDSLRKSYPPCQGWVELVTQVRWRCSQNQEQLFLGNGKGRCNTVCNQLFASLSHLAWPPWKRYSFYFHIDYFMNNFDFLTGYNVVLHFPVQSQFELHSSRNLDIRFLYM